MFTQALNRSRLAGNAIVLASTLVLLIPLERTLGNLVVIVFSRPVFSTAWFFEFRPWAGGQLPLSGGRQWTIN